MGGRWEKRGRRCDELTRGSLERVDFIIGSTEVT